MRSSTFIIVALLILALPASVHAAGIELVADDSRSNIKDVIDVYVKIDANTEPVGALEGSLIVPPEFEITGVSTDGSIVSYWINEAEVGNKSVSFAMMFPGGYSGNSTLFTLTLRAVKEGRAVFALGQDTTLFAADGVSTIVQSGHKLDSIVIGPALDTPRVAVQKSDTTPPEPFTPGVADMQLVFNANDRGVGGVTYTIQRSLLPIPFDFLAWESVASPYELTTFDTLLALHIMATDKAGNERLSRFVYYTPVQIVIDSWLTLVVIPVLLILYFIIRMSTRRRVSRELTQVPPRIKV